jgi:hypothetical protein
MENKPLYTFDSPQKIADAFNQEFGDCARVENDKVGMPRLWICGPNGQPILIVDIRVDAVDRKTWGLFWEPGHRVFAVPEGLNIQQNSSTVSTIAALETGAK